MARASGAWTQQQKRHASIASTSMGLARIPRRAWQPMALHSQAAATAVPAAAAAPAGWQGQTRPPAHPPIGGRPPPAAPAAPPPARPPAAARRGWGEASEGVPRGRCRGGRKQPAATPRDATATATPRGAGGAVQARVPRGSIRQTTPHAKPLALCHPRHPAQQTQHPWRTCTSGMLRAGTSTRAMPAACQAGVARTGAGRVSSEPQGQRATGWHTQPALPLC